METFEIVLIVFGVSGWLFAGAMALGFKGVILAGFDMIPKDYAKRELELQEKRLREDGNPANDKYADMLAGLNRALEILTAQLQATKLLDAQTTAMRSQVHAESPINATAEIAHKLNREEIGEGSAGELPLTLTWNADKARQDEIDNAQG